VIGMEKRTHYSYAAGASVGCDTRGGSVVMTPALLHNTRARSAAHEIDSGWWRPHGEVILK
jgi:hypothetical protein